MILLRSSLFCRSSLTTFDHLQPLFIICYTAVIPLRSSFFCRSPPATFHNLQPLFIICYTATVRHDSAPLLCWSSPTTFRHLLQLFYISHLLSPSVTCYTTIVRHDSALVFILLLIISYYFSPSPPLFAISRHFLTICYMLHCSSRPWLRFFFRFHHCSFLLPSPFHLSEK